MQRSDNPLTDKSVTLHTLYTFFVFGLLTLYIIYSRQTIEFDMAFLICVPFTKTGFSYFILLALLKDDLGNILRGKISRIRLVCRPIILP